MYRSDLLRQLDRYAQRYPEEHTVVERIADFVDGQPSCFLRRCRPGHITASALVLSAERDRCLLVHHRKLGVWVQPGGHADGEPEVQRMALREVQEETGLWDVALAAPTHLIPLDVDIHSIPEGGGDPRHLHYDIRYLVLATAGGRPRAGPESHDVRWFDLDGVGQVTREESVLRLTHKARDLLG